MGYGASMETNCNAAGLTPQVLVLGIPRQATHPEATIQTKVSTATDDCVRVHRELAQTSRLEARVWIAIAVSAAASLLLSFWLM